MRRQIKSCFLKQFYLFCRAGREQSGKMRVYLVKHIKILQLLYEPHVSSSKLVLFSSKLVLSPSKLVLLSEQSERKGHRPPEAGLGRDENRRDALGQ
ncbi:hypothetical protein DU31_06215 [Methanosarcina mazei]|uniref:Uncharacterized protein n=2 Tax=Methanosarcina mazei TaxID=2209 RepID=A0A0F8R198_METMZ|nr:hypothetical protein DU31_06215 [Methanosarcina mazei]KKH28339.1 hypothetical protein DU58_07330 [Methanosarcina mazei]KKH81252.1 hypothetical protein DU82_17215 [Methanosarcina mazei]KKH89501.1 hypothetical protein DU88_16385 [Methanosarcina mazei]